MFEVNSKDTRKTAAQKLKFSIKDFFSKCDQIRSFLPIWSHLLKKSLLENLIFYAVLDNLLNSAILVKAFSFPRAFLHTSEILASILV